MKKIDNKKSKNICAMFLSLALSQPLLGCSLGNRFQKENSNKISSNIVITEEESKIKLHLSNEEIDKILNSKEEFITVNLGNNKVILEAKPIKEQIQREDRMRKSRNNIANAGALIMLITTPVYIKHETKKLKKTI